MNIAIESSALTNDHSRRGIGSYTKLLVDSLKQYDSGNSYIFFTRQLDQWKSIDLIHYTYYEFFKRTQKLSKDIKSVVTLHDMIPFQFPEKFPVGIRGKIAWFFQKKELFKANALITDSDASKEAIAKFTGYPAEKIYVVHLAVDPAFRPLTSKVHHRDKIANKYRLSKKYILYVGDVNWNKNISGLIESFTLLKKNPRWKEVTLVMAGNAMLKKDLKEIQELDRLIEKNNLTDFVRKLGFVPQSDLVELYNNSVLYAQVSWSEGFGIPVLEAMSCGTPVVVSQAGSLPEVAGRAGHYCNPADPKDIANMFEKILSLSPQAYLKLRTDSLQQAARFSMEKFVRDTIHVYEMVFRSSPD